MERHYDHIDLRVPRLAEVRGFYERLLPALGFTRDARVEGWLQFEAGDGEITEFFGITESPTHVPNENRIAFWAESPSEVDLLAAVAREAGAQNIDVEVLDDASEIDGGHTATPANALAFGMIGATVAARSKT